MTYPRTRRWPRDWVEFSRGLFGPTGRHDTVLVRYTGCTGWEMEVTVVSTRVLIDSRNDMSCNPFVLLVGTGQAWLPGYNH